MVIHVHYYKQKKMIHTHTHTNETHVREPHKIGKINGSNIQKCNWWIGWDTGKEQVNLVIPVDSNG